MQGVGSSPHKSAQSASISVSADAEEAKRTAKRGWYDKLPLFLRAVLYFKYVFFLRGGFLDGPKGWHYHWLRSLWYPWNIDREIVRLRKSLPLG